jgi:hypothetical protein
MLRAYVLARNGSSGLRLGLGTVMTRGLAAWMGVARELIPAAPSVPVSSWEAASVPQFVQDEVIQVMGEAVITLAYGESL